MVKLAHVAIAVKDLERAVKIYTELLDRSPESIQEIPEQNIKLALFVTPAAAVELISPIDSDSNIQKFLDRQGEGLHHISLSVPNISKKLQELKAKGYRLIDESPRTGAEGHKIAFLHPSGCNGVLIELEED